MLCRFLCVYCFFFFNDPATTEIYTLSLHDALPISGDALAVPRVADRSVGRVLVRGAHRELDRKSTRLNSSHANISYAVFCLKKKKKKTRNKKQQESPPKYTPALEYNNANYIQPRHH